jgi:hypothetical protein
MKGIRRRVTYVKWLMNDKPLGDEDFGKLLRTELNFVQFRKILELIAFSTLTANKEKYAEAYKNFSTHWKAVKMLEAVEKLNPDFYPRPLNGPTKQPNGTWHFSTPEGGYLTRDEFVELYDACGGVLHVRNPFAGREHTIDLPYNPNQYADRIRGLLKQHLVQMVDGKTVWLVTITNDNVLVQNATAVQTPNDLAPEV